MWVQAKNWWQLDLSPLKVASKKAAGRKLPVAESLDVHLVIYFVLKEKWPKIRIYLGS